MILGTIQMISRHLVNVPGKSEAFEAKVHSLSTFVKKDLPLVVPEFQREYVWDKENVRRFLDDTDDHRLVGMKEFFIGSLICSTEESGIPEPEKIAKMRRKALQRIVDDEAIGQHLPAFPEIGVLRKTVLAKVPNSKLVDGQQRMTTLSIISKVLIGWLEKLDIQDRKAELEGVIWRDIEGGPAERLRLSLRPGDDKYYETITSKHKHGEARKLHDDRKNWETKSGKSNSRYRAMRTAYLEIDSWLQRFHDKYEADEHDDPKTHFKRFTGYLLDNTKIIFINVKEPKQEQAVFQSLNATGESLTESEKVKSHLFHRAALKKCSERVEANWTAMMTTLESIERWSSNDPATEFLHIWAKAKRIGVSAGVISKAQVYNGFREYIEDNGLNTKNGLEELSSELSKDAGRYREILNPNNGLLVHEDLIDFRANGVQHLPFFLAVHKENSDSSKKELRKSIIAASRLFDVLDGRTRLTGKITSNKVETPLNLNWIRWYREHGEIRTLRKIKLDIFRILREVNGIGSAIACPDAIDQLDSKFEEQLKGKVAADNAKYYLRKIEEVGGWKDYNRVELQAEHIFPNSQSNEGKFLWWSEVKSFGESGWWPESRDERKEMANQLGNYLILEEELNKAADRRTWKANTPRGYLYLKSSKRLSAMSKAGGKTDQWQDLIAEKGGKFQIYTRKKHYSNVSGGPREAYGSQLKHVRDFCKSYEKSPHWTPALMKRRTINLAKKGAKKKCWSLRGWKLDTLQAEEHFADTRDQLKSADTRKKLESIDLSGFEGENLEELGKTKKGVEEKINEEIKEAAKKKIVGEIEGINPDAATEGLGLEALKELKKDEKHEKVMSHQKKWAKIAMGFMVPETRYGKKDIIDLIEENYDSFTEEEVSENASEETVPKWHRWIGNALRCTPDSDSTSQNWWTELRADKLGNRWMYWIE